MGGSRKLANFRVRPETTIVARVGWEWIAVEGAAEIIGPDDPAPGIDDEALRLLLRAIFTAASDGLSRKIYMYPNSADTAKYWFFTGFISGSVTSAVDGATTIAGKFAASSDVIAVGIT